MGKVALLIKKFMLSDLQIVVQLTNTFRKCDRNHILRQLCTVVNYSAVTS